jgi:hypothetical protein
VNKCCGKERDSEFCPDCGRSLRPLEALEELLAAIKKNARYWELMAIHSLDDVDQDNGAFRPEARPHWRTGEQRKAYFAACARRETANAARWRGWIQALENGMTKNGAKVAKPSVACCGKDQATQFCAGCGKRLRELEPLEALLKRVQLTANNFREAIKKAPVKAPSYNSTARTKEENKQFAAKWQRWANALAELIK